MEIFEVGTFKSHPIKNDIILKGWLRVDLNQIYSIEQIDPWKDANGEHTGLWKHYIYVRINGAEPVIMQRQDYAEFWLEWIRNK